jgi:hypothetical protein
MVRNVLGSVFAAIGAAAAVWSPFRAWYHGRQGRYFRLTELFSGSGITGRGAELFASLFLPFLVAAVVTLAGIVVRSRLLVAVAGLIVLAFTVLWMVREGQAQGSLTVGSDGTGLGVGVAQAFGGGLLLLLGALVMRGRRGRGRHVKGYGEPRGPTGPYDHGKPESYGSGHSYDPYEPGGGPEHPSWQQRPPPDEQR